MLHFLVPSDPFDPRKPDEIFRDQAAALQEHGFGVSLFSLEEVQAGNFKVRGPIPTGATVVYRGWMVTPYEYDKIVALVQSREAVPFTSPDQYLSCHYLPNWYPRLAEFTAETKVYHVGADMEAELKALGWGKFFLKDYVKSLNTSVGSVVSKPEDVHTVLSEMKKFRGTIEGGICVRRFESFLPGSEKRFFVIRGVPHGPSGSVPELVSSVAQRIASPFFAVDVAARDDGVHRVVEVGDGQVSDLRGWEPPAFAQLWQA